MRPPRADTRVCPYISRIKACPGLPSRSLGDPAKRGVISANWTKTLPNAIKIVTLHAGRKTSCSAKL